MTPLTLVLIGAAVFVVVGAAGALKLGDWLDKTQKRRAKDAEDEVW